MARGAGSFIAQLAARVNLDDPTGALPPAELERWLVDTRLAERRADGRLRMTRQAWQLAGLAFG